jgi:hypothetical protein
MTGVGGRLRAHSNCVVGGAHSRVKAKDVETGVESQ